MSSGRRFLQQRGLSNADLAAMALRELKLRKFKTETWGNKIESYFLQRKKSPGSGAIFPDSHPGTRASPGTVLSHSG